jgi:hypothetical protein
MSLPPGIGRLADSRAIMTEATDRCGAFVKRARGCPCLPDWTSRNRAIEDGHGRPPGLERNCDRQAARTHDVGACRLANISPTDY